MKNSRMPTYHQYISENDDRMIKKLLHKVIGGMKHTKRMANAVGCNHQDMLNRISNQPRSPRKFELVFRILLEASIERREVFVRWFNTRLGFLPPVRMSRITPTTETAQIQVIEGSKEMGDVSREFLEAYSDKKIDQQEAERIKKEADDVILKMLTLKNAVRKAVEQNHKEDYV